MNAKEKINFVVCPKCNESILTFVLRHSTNEELIEKVAKIKYCPLCGKEIN